ncbi:MAG: leucine-rich repeat protein [Spirochaetes bacterium]|uniref:Leucine-rich repeat protein n=1 Tax=Candidatus Ornithospirochaeta stercoripullorum TaxID=2840899 RepID=A0A9D9DX82_9SPIO|nr:leucine-rich repeat protein [Candidatus Ornithospirochaeta stercoripullorum]
MRIDDFEVKRLDSKSCSVVQYKGDDENIAIPEKLGKYSTVRIEASLVRRGLKARSISIPASISEIDEDLFPSLKYLERFEVAKGSLSFRAEDGILYDSSCYSLIFYPPAKEDGTFVLPKRLGRVAGTAFSAGAKIETIQYGSKLEEFQALPSQLPRFSAFVPSDDAPDYEGVLIKGKKLLFYPPKREGASYVIPDGVEEIYSLSQEPFFPKSVKNLYVPSSMKKGLERALCNAVKVDVDSHNATYRSIDGVLYSWKRVLLSYPGERRDGVYVTASGTDRIGSGAFRLSRLETLVLSNGVTAIGDSAFASSAISTLVIPSTVSEIDIHAFFSAENLKEVFVEKGSVAELFLRADGKERIIRVVPSLF